MLAAVSAGGTREVPGKKKQNSPGPRTWDDFPEQVSVTWRDGCDHQRLGGGREEASGMGSGVCKGLNPSGGARTPKRI